MTAFRTMIVPVGAMTTLAQDLCKGLAGIPGDGMFKTGISPTHQPPATHTISSGPIGAEFAALLPLTSVDAECVATTVPGQPEMIVGAAALKGITVTLEEITALLDAIDVSVQPPFVAMARLGLQMVQVPLK